MLVAFSQPHFAQYDWKMPARRRTNGYAHHAAFYVRVAGNHPSVVFYAMSHNATGYDEDMNPDMIDGIHAVRDQWSGNNVKRALAAEAIVARLDPGRIVYHHSSGNLGSMHTMQLLHEHGPRAGAGRLVRALGHEGRQAAVHLRVHGALHLGLDDVSRLVQGRADLRQAPRCRGNSASPSGARSSWATGLPDRRGGEEEPTLGGPAVPQRAGSGIAGTTPTRSAPRCSTSSTTSSATYLAGNWRAFRTWGVSAISPWEYDFFWTPPPGSRQEPQAAQGRLGGPATARLQPGLYRRAV